MFKVGFDGVNPEIFWKGKTVKTWQRGKALITTAGPALLQRYGKKKTFPGDRKGLASKTSISMTRLDGVALGRRSAQPSPLGKYDPGEEPRGQPNLAEGKLKLC